MRALVVTIVHVPSDARIAHRQIPALLRAGWEVIYAAPWSGYGEDPPDGWRTIDLPRAQGRRRLSAVRAARRLIGQLGRDADLILLHDPELLLAVAGVRGLPPVVWDVHEDTAATLLDKPWLGPVPPAAVAGLVRAAERWAERRLHLILAEEAYAARFQRPHPVVPNHPWVPCEVPAPGDDRVVYVGRVSRLRGARELVAVAEALGGHPLLEVVGPADPDVRPLLEAAERRGVLRWYGYRPNREAVRHIAGALAGLALLHDVPNYRVSLPSKVLEYLAWGVPVITTPLPAAVRIVAEEAGGAGIVVPFGAVDEVVDAIRRLAADPDLRRTMGQRGRQLVAAHYDWAATADRFVAHLRTWVEERGRGR